MVSNFKKDLHSAICINPDPYEMNAYLGHSKVSVPSSGGTVL
jgi:hypothetical protein